MGQFFEILLATVIGGMFMLTVISANYRLKATSVDLDNQLNLARNSEEVIKILDQGYLSRVGYGVPDTTRVITTALKNRIQYLSKVHLTDATNTSFIVRQGALVNGRGYPLEVLRNNRVIMGPFYLADSLSFTYYNVDGGKIKTPYDAVATSDSLDRICSVKVDAAFTRYNPNTQSPVKYVYRVTFWRYFTNLYVRQLSAAAS